MNARQLLVISSILIVTGCKSALLSCPKPPDIQKPRLAIESIKPNTPPEQIIRAYGQSLEQCVAYSSALEDALKLYRNIPDTDLNRLKVPTASSTVNKPAAGTSRDSNK